MIRKIISTIIILAGLLIIAYPKISESYHDYKQQKIIEEWQQSFSAVENSYNSIEKNNETISLSEKTENEDTDNDISSTEELNNTAAQEDIKKKKKEDEKKAKEEFIKKNMEGMLKIEKINLSLPILHGATQENLKVSIASIENTGKAGEVGNYSIAGHRSHTFGRNFNRLDELEMGDIVEVDDGKNQYKYTVSEKLYVKPEEVWVLNGNKKDKEITLVTCHPMINPTHRLIVKGKINE